MKMKVAKTISWLGLFSMTAGLINGFVNGNFMEDGKKLLENPWGVMSMIDLYVGFVLFSMWIFHREKNIVKAIIWTFFMMTLGFFTASVYLLKVLYTSGDDWDMVFHGRENR